jgi:hypothetical protein
MMGKGINGHQSTNNQTNEWLTPPGIIAALGVFDLDPCSPVNRPWPTAARHYTIEDDGLFLPWFGRVWLNPPYGNYIGEWMQKMALHGNGIALTFARTETRFFFDHIWPHADSILFMKGRPTFHRIDGTPGASTSGGPMVLISYGAENVDAIEESKLPGKHLMINRQTIVCIGYSATWLTIVKIAARNYSDSELAPVYEMVARMAPDKVQKNQHWKAKVRQCMQVIKKNLGGRAVNVNLEN